MILTVEPDRPGVDGIDDEVRAAPRVLREAVPDVVLRRRLDHEHDAVLVGQRASKHDEAVVHERVHERRVGRPPGLRLQPAGGVPRRARAAQDDEKHHAPDPAVRSERATWRSCRPKWAGSSPTPRMARTTRSAIAGPCLNPCPDPPPTIQTPSCTGCGAAMKFESGDSS